MLLYLLSITPDEQHSKVECLYNSFHDNMLRFAKCRLKYAGRTSYETDAEDVVQNAFIKVVKYIDAINFEADDAEIKSYLITIVINETKNFLKQNVYADDIDAHPELIDDEDFLEKMTAQEDYERLLRLIETLDEKYRTVLFFKFVKRMDMKQIAEILGLNEKTIYTQVARAKVLLLNLLRGKKDNDD